MPDDNESISSVLRGAGRRVVERINSPGKFAGELFAARTTRNNAVAVFRIAAGSVGRTGGYIRAMFGKSQSRRFDFGDIEDASARYKEALAQSGNALREAAIYKRILKLAEIRYFFALAVTAFAILAIDAGGPLHRFVAGGLTGYPADAALATPFLLASLLWACTARLSFYSFQMRRRALLPFSKFLMSPGEWLPTDMPGQRAVQFLIISGMSALAAQHTGLGVGTAIAAGTQTIAQLAGGAGGGSTAISASTVVHSLLGNLSASDLSFQWMANLFPSQFSSTTGVSYQSDAVAQLIEVINTAVFGLAAIMLSWHVTAGLISTARDGVFLGERWHTVYAPLRIGMGVVGAAPVAGYAGAQILIIQLALAGCGLANLAWTSYVNSATGQTTGMIAITVPPNTLNQTKIFDSIVGSATCYEAARYYFRPAGQTEPLSEQSLVQYAAQRGMNGARPLFEDPLTGNGAGGAQPMSETYDFGQACGGVRLPSISNTATSTQSTSTIGAGSTPATFSPYGLAASFPTGGQSAASQAESQFETARDGAFRTFMNELMASKYVQDEAMGNVPGGVSINNVDLTSSLSKLRGDYAKYEEAVLQAAGTLQRSLNENEMQTIAQKSVLLGWASAGAMEPQIITAEAQVDSDFSQKPVIITAQPSLAASEQFMGIVQKTQSDVNAAETVLEVGALPSLTGTSGGSSNNSGPDSVASRTQLAASIKGNPANMLQDLGKYDSTWLESFIVNQGKLNTINPLASISSIGLETKSAGYGVFAVYEGALFWASAAKTWTGNSLWGRVASAFSGGTTTAGASGLAAVIRSLVFPVDILAMWLIVTGLTMEYLIPLLGYTIWVSAIVMYVLFIVEAVVGGTFWAFSHVRADGNELINNEQSYGWRILPVLLFYPTLMVLGLIFANVVMSAVLGFVDSTFTPALNGIGAIWDPFGIAAIMTLIAGVYYNVITRSYRLITWIPEWVMSWMGGASFQRDPSHNEGANVHQTAMRDTQSSTKGGVGRARDGFRSSGGNPAGQGPVGGNGGSQSPSVGNDG